MLQEQLGEVERRLDTPHVLMGDARTQVREGAMHSLAIVESLGQKTRF